MDTNQTKKLKPATESAGCKNKLSQNYSALIPDNNKYIEQEIGFSIHISSLF
jgi:hypothetical protein